MEHLNQQSVLVLIHFNSIRDPNYLMIWISTGDRTKNVIFSEVLLNSLSNLFGPYIEQVSD